MDVARVLRLVGPFLEGRGEPWALVGGLAVLAWGAPRATFDADVLVPRDVQGDLVRFLEAKGFRTLSLSPGFSSHEHEDPGLGRVDVLYVDGPTAQAVFGGCSRRSLCEGLEAPVPRAEHLVAMKVQAFARDRERFSDLADLRFLLGLPGLDIDEARGYFEQAGLLDYFERLRRR